MLKRQSHAELGWNMADGDPPTATGPVRRDSEHEYVAARVNHAPFVGQLGGNGYVPLDPTKSRESLVEDIPDAAPLMTLAQVFDLRPFRTIGLWKAALIEGIGKWFHYSKKPPRKEHTIPESRLTYAYGRLHDAGLANCTRQLISSNHSSGTVRATRPIRQHSLRRATGRRYSQLHLPDAVHLQLRRCIWCPL
jgi:hypothetical protein